MFNGEIKFVKTPFVQDTVVGWTYCVIIAGNIHQREHRCCQIEESKHKTATKILNKTIVFTLLKSEQ